MTPECRILQFLDVKAEAIHFSENKESKILSPVFINKFQLVSQLSVNDHSKFSWNPSHIDYSSCLDASADALALKYLVLTPVLTHWLLVSSS